MTVLSCDNLIAMGRHVPTPFQFSIMEGETEQVLKIESILRIVPGKRIVALSTWKKQQVIVKLFFHAGHWKRNQLRDIKGINLLRQAKVLTPKIVFQSSASDQKGGVLLIEHLLHGISLGSLFAEALDDIGKREVLRLAIESIATCHQAGLLQKDIHLDNFMSVKGRVYLLDGGDIVAMEKGLDVKLRLENLALFFAQFPVVLDSDLKSFMQIYQDLGFPLNTSQLAEFPAQVIQARQGRLRQFERKLFRSTTAIRCVQEANRFLVYDRSIHSPALDAFINNPDSAIETGKILKDGNSSTVAKVTIGDREFVLKRYNIKSIAHGLSRLFRPSRAHHSWRNAWMLEMLGVSTTRPYLFMEERVLWWFRRRAYFLCELVAGTCLNEANAGSKLALPDEKQLLSRFGSLFRIMADYRISHGDMKATNFILERGKLSVLDLDAMRRHKGQSSFATAFAKDKARFKKNWQGTSLEAPVAGMLERLHEVPGS